MRNRLVRLSSRQVRGRGSGLLSLPSRLRRGRRRGAGRDWRGAMGSEDGGFEEFSELRPSSASSAAMRSRNDAFSAMSSLSFASNCPLTNRNAATCSANS